MKFIKATVFFLLCFFSSEEYAQQSLSTKSTKAENMYFSGLREYDHGSYVQAIQLFKQAILEDSDFAEAWLLLGEIYETLKMPDSAITAYRNFAKINPAIHPRAFFNLATLEYSQGLYKESEQHFLDYLKYPIRSEDTKIKAQLSLQRTQTALNFVSNPVTFNPINLGDSINTEMDEYFPTLTVDQKTFVMTKRTKISDNSPSLSSRIFEGNDHRIAKNTSSARRNPNAITVSKKGMLPMPHFREDFFFSTFSEAHQIWGKASPMPSPLSSENNEGAQSISPDGRYLYFTGCLRESGKGSCDIYVSKKTGDSWGEPFNLLDPINTAAWESQPSIAPDGKTLYFSSNRGGGRGNSDIWYSVLQDNGLWSEPVNLGDSVNTGGSETSPFIHYDNHTLYFASDGHSGLGGKDLFYVRKKADGTWGTPINLGYPINSNKDEISLFVNSTGDMAYIASDRSGGKGGQDIYAFELYRDARPLAVSYVRGKLFDANSLSPLEAKFEIINLNTGKIIAGAESDEISGDFLVSLPSEGDYALNVSKDGYLFHSEHFDVGSIANQIKPKEIDVPLSEIKKGETMVLRNIFFETNKYELKSESTQELERLIKMMRENATLQIEISGHTDNSGSESLNQRLSENRAKSVYDFLILHGISASRLKYIGYGMSRPIASNDTEDGRAKNRRTEIKII